MSADLTIITNNQPRLLLCGFELSKKEQKDFDYCLPLEDETSDVWAQPRFFRYRGSVYDANDMMPVERRALYPKEFDSWHAYASDSFFSGILIRYVDDFESVVVARYTS